MKNIIITGSAGFIGFHLSKLLLDKKYRVFGVDNLSNSYDVKLKKLRTSVLKKSKNFFFYKREVSDINKIRFKKIDYIIHLAAEAGVRRSIEDPYLYIDKNISATISIFDFARKNKIKNVFYASSSSVYGDKNIYPSTEKINTNQPISIYSITKIATENIAYYYNKIFSINSIGYRFFTVYGTYGRPDMSIFIFVKSILQNKYINLNNYGNNYRDYTYVDDVVRYIYDSIQKVKNKKNFFKILNIGGENTIKLKNLVKLLEKKLKKKAKIKFKKRILLDPVNSLANSNKIKLLTGRKYQKGLNEGLDVTIEWLKKYLNIND